MWSTGKQTLTAVASGHSERVYTQNIKNNSHDDHVDTESNTILLPDRKPDFPFESRKPLSLVCYSQHTSSIRIYNAQKKVAFFSQAGDLEFIYMIAVSRMRLRRIAESGTCSDPGRSTGPKTITKLCINHGEHSGRTLKN
jgi:hypothetical protein